MTQNITLVVMAAGMGSRFGGLKQAATVSEDGRAILDFSVQDAVRAGFNKVVFIIRKETEEEFRRLVGSRIEKTVECHYVYQSTDILPEGRKKPFGTGHAILSCRDIVKEPFLAINADDYYGSNAFFEIAEHLKAAKPGEYAMTAYRLSNTLSKNGTVSRGICTVKNGLLASVDECTAIASDCTYTDKDGKVTAFAPETKVSMNLWGLTTDIFDILDEKFNRFLKEADLMKDEFYIPFVISEALEEGRATVRVYENCDKWYGITYKEDMPELKAAIDGYIQEGLY